MSRLRISHVVAAAAMVSASALLPLAVALADSLDYVPDPYSEISVSEMSGLPPWYQDVVGTQTFDVVDNTTGGTVIGNFVAARYDFTTAWGLSNTEVFVESHVPGSTGDPAVGSVFDTLNFGNGFENFYSDLVGAGINGTNVITDTLVTPFGDVDLSPYVSFDAALNPLLELS